MSDRKNVYINNDSKRIKKINIKCIVSVAKYEYRKWLVNPKFFIFLVALMILYELKTVPLLRASSYMDSPVNALEPCIAVLNSEMGVLLLGMVYLFLMSSFPTSNENIMFYIFRMGRRNWILGEILFQFISAVTYVILVTAVTLVQVYEKCFFANGWSLVVTEFNDMYSLEAGFRLSGIISPNLYYQMAPFESYIYSFGLFSLFLVICGITFLTGCLYRKRLLFFIIQMLHILAGFILISIDSGFKWYLPASHSILAVHFNGYLRKYILSPWVSLFLYLVLLLIVGIVMYRKAAKVSIDMIGGDILQ
ncbi:MAG: hypothetical protein HFH14_03735 [Lachnospiraceae bacterium]|nr:hypothetical protein [Lachnospiraceae bacterium]